MLKSPPAAFSQDIAASPRHGPLTISPARTDVALFIHYAVRLISLCVADLAAALPVEKRVSARRGWAGENSSLFEHPEVIPAVAC